MLSVSPLRTFTRQSWREAVRDTSQEMGPAGS